LSAELAVAGKEEIGDEHRHRHCNTDRRERTDCEMVLAHQRGHAEDGRNGAGDYALNKDETRGWLAGVQYTTVSVDTVLARVNPNVIGYASGYYQWDNNWKLAGRLGVQAFGGAQVLNLVQFQPFTQPIVRKSISTGWTTRTTVCSAFRPRSPGRRSRPIN
jgi:hypothetical protein